ncbi:MAG TPA: universal stress protein [Solirubrobacteraceae bacterium]|nr:universal stress protein [Solirubrobacteraceae bacterium]
MVAAIADDSAASTVLSLAGAIATLYRAAVEAVHVGEAHARLAATAQSAGVCLRTVPGRPVEVLTHVAGAEDVVAVAIGAGGSASHDDPAGGTVMALLPSLEKPVVVVPANARVAHAIESMLVPLDGTAASATALHEIVTLAADAEIKIVVAHVHQERSLPAFSDHLAHEVRAWSEEFLARYCPSAIEVTLESRVGEPHEHLLDILRRSGCDLVALGWSQDLARGRAAVVRRMLAESPVPVLLTPASSDSVTVSRAQPPARTFNGVMRVTLQAG